MTTMHTHYFIKHRMNDTPADEGKYCLYWSNLPAAEQKYEPLSASEVMTRIVEGLKSEPNESSDEQIYFILDYEPIEDEQGYSETPFGRIDALREEYGDGATFAAMTLAYALEEAEGMLEGGYHGSWDNELEFATNLFDDLYLHDVPANLLSYIDYEAFSYDIFIDDYVSQEWDRELYVFSKNY